MAAWIVVAICGVALSTVRAAEVAATPANSASETRREKVELLRDGSVAESLARRIDVGFGSVRIDGEKSNVPLSSLTADQVLSAETTKVPTPDLDADAVGGLLQLTSRRTFDQAAPTMRASAGGGYDALTGQVNPEASVTYGRPLGERFGFVVTGSGGRETSRGQGIDSDAAPQRFQLNVESTRSDTDPANYHVQQDVLATYLMTAAALGRRVRVLAGARVERTMNDFTGYEVVFDQAGRYEATNRLAAASDYTNVFPGIHLLITPVPKLELLRRRRERDGGPVADLRRRSQPGGGILARAPAFSFRGEVGDVARSPNGAGRHHLGGVPAHLRACSLP